MLNEFSQLAMNNPELFDDLCAQDLAKDPDHWQRIQRLLNPDAVKTVKARQEELNLRNKEIESTLQGFKIPNAVIQLAQQYDTITDKKQGLFDKSKQAQVKTQQSTADLSLGQRFLKWWRT